MCFAVVHPAGVVVFGTGMNRYLRFPSGRAFVLSGDALYQRSSLCTGHPPGVL
jgi:hypothetical protein